MVLVATKDLGLAKQLLDAIDDEVSFILTARDATDVRRQVHVAQPEVLILDARFGVNSYRAIGVLPRLIGVRSRPQAIVLLPWRSKAARTEALRLGAFEVLILTDAAFPRSVDEAVSLAKQERALLLKRSALPEKMTKH